MKKEGIELLCENDEINSEKSSSKGVPLYTNVTGYIMHDADLEQSEAYTP